MKTKRSVLLGSVGLCLFTFACGGSNSGSGDDGAGDASSAGGATVGGAASSTGGSAVTAAGQTGVAGSVGTAGTASFPAGGASQGGSGGGAGGSVSGGAGGAGGAGGVNTGGAGSSAGGVGGAAQGGSGGAAGSALDPSVVPGKNFDLSHFTLQLPVADGSSVQQVTNLAGYTSQWFFTGKDGAMTFWCPVSGAHTPNTHYPRTELRENATGGDWQISGTHSLTATFKVLEAPSSKGTIIGQIHGNATDGTGEVLKLEWLSTGEIIASVEDNTDPATQVNKTLGTYALNDELTYSIQLANSSLTVSVTGPNGTKTITSPYTASSWTKDTYYFKLGDYVQLAGTSTTDGGKVAFYAFTIKHG